MKSTILFILLTFLFSFSVAQYCNYYYCEDYGYTYQTLCAGTCSVYCDGNYDTTNVQYCQYGCRYGYCYIPKYCEINYVPFIPSNYFCAGIVNWAVDQNENLILDDSDALSLYNNLIGTLLLANGTGIISPNLTVCASQIKSFACRSAYTACNDYPNLNYCQSLCMSNVYQCKNTQAMQLYGVGAAQCNCVSNCGLKIDFCKKTTTATFDTTNFFCKNYVTYPIDSQVNLDLNDIMAHNYFNTWNTSLSVNNASVAANLVVYNSTCVSVFQNAACNIEFLNCNQQPNYQACMGYCSSVNFCKQNLASQIMANGTSTDQLSCANLCSFSPSLHTLSVFAILFVILLMFLFN
jgi:hypothetical protein